MLEAGTPEPASAFNSSTFGKDVSFEVDKPVGSMSISPCGRDVVLASRQGLHIIDLDSPYATPRHLSHHTPWEVADVQWSPFPSRDYWVVSTSNQKALVWNLAMASSEASIEHILHAHTRAITDINFSAHHPDLLATCAVDSFVHCWDLRNPAKPALTFCDWFAGATQVKWNRQDSHIVASSHDKFLRIWDDRKGAYPLRSIEAHDTKIYGLDWNRTHVNGIVTCSLDKTIKFWDYTNQVDEPERVIQTPFPVWRARHTPFGWGILAMPQRGDNDLHLYDRRLNESTKMKAYIKPVHSFEGHQNHVKEFLWRPRGTIEAGVDNREFQLVSWGSDRFLRLHHVGDAVLGRVGYEKGKEVHKKYNLTRKNAPYKTFREDSLKLGNNTASVAIIPIQGSGQISNGHDIRGSRAEGMTMGVPASSSVWENGDFLTARPGMRNKAATRVDIDPIAWMKGVKIGKGESGLDRSTMSVSTAILKAGREWDDFESLGEEITYVGEKFKKVDFHEVDVQSRFVRLSLYGPWGSNDNYTFLNCRLDFPVTYPSSAIPSFSVEKTASIDQDVALKLKENVAIISKAYLAYQRGSLEAVARYLQGEGNVEDIIDWTIGEQADNNMMFPDVEDDSSSGEEDELSVFANNTTEDIGLTGSGVLMSSNANANVPLPKACGAVWADNGRLICFFPPKEEKAHSLLGSLGLGGVSMLSTRKTRWFEGFGKLDPVFSMGRTKSSRIESVDTEDLNSETGSANSSTSSSYSSVSSRDLSSPRHQSKQSYAFQPGTLHLSHAADGSHRSNGSLSMSRSGVPVVKNIISIHNFEGILPAKTCLAEHYAIIGPNACRTNSEVAFRKGFRDLADIWSLLDLILCDEVPLEAFSENDAENTFLVVAHPKNHSLTGKDRGIDLSFDAKSQVGIPRSYGSSKWGRHPLGNVHLVKVLFSHFERLADVQMLAMMSCVLSHYPLITSMRDRSGSPANMKQTSSERNCHDLRISRAFPPYTEIPQSYYPSHAVAISLLHPTPAMWTTRENAKRHVVDPPSFASSFGASSSDPNTPLSTGGTPPLIYRPNQPIFERPDLSNQVMSTSPEYFRHPQRSNSNSASAFAASFPLPFGFNASASSSPPSSYVKKRDSPAGSYGTGHPQSTTWGAANNIFGRSWSGTEELKSRSTTSEFRQQKFKSNKRQAKMKVSLKNQHRFDDEGHSSTPLLDYMQRGRYRQYRDAYAHLLFIWGLPMARSEMLQYNNISAMINNPSEIESVIPKTSPILGRKSSHAPVVIAEGLTLELVRTCSECGDTIGLEANKLPLRCLACRSNSIPLLCALCDKVIRGRAAPCLGCGHVLHAACISLLTTKLDYSKDPGMWICGCDCCCMEQVVVEVKWPNEDKEPVPSLSLRFMVTNEVDKYALGDDYHMWEDVAYESLAKNLGVAGLKSLKPKTSQIWRGRKKRGKSFAE